MQQFSDFIFVLHNKYWLYGLWGCFTTLIYQNCTLIFWVVSLLSETAGNTSPEKLWNNEIAQSSANCFCKGPAGEQFRLCRPEGLCCSSQLFAGEQPQKRGKPGWPWNRTRPPSAPALAWDLLEPLKPWNMISVCPCFNSHPWHAKEFIASTDSPWHTVELHPDKPIINWICKLEFI